MNIITDDEDEAIPGFNSFQCKISKIYINIHYICDGIKDCFHGEDEENCSINLFFTCHSSKKKISILHFCDFRNDCQDNSDEKFCSLAKFFIK